MAVNDRYDGPIIKQSKGGTKRVFTDKTKPDFGDGGGLQRDQQGRAVQRRQRETDNLNAAEALRGRERELTRRIPGIGKRPPAGG